MLVCKLPITQTMCSLSKQMLKVFEGKGLQLHDTIFMNIQGLKRRCIYMHIYKNVMGMCSMQFHLLHPALDAHTFPKAPCLWASPNMFANLTAISHHILYQESVCSTTTTNHHAHVCDYWPWSIQSCSANAYHTAYLRIFVHAHLSTNSSLFHPISWWCAATTEAIAMSQACILGGSSVTSLFNSLKRLPSNPPRPLIHFLVCLIALPMLYSGEAVGAVCRSE